MPANPAKTLLNPDNHSLLLVALGDAAAMFKVPTLTTTAFQERQGWSRHWPRRPRQSSRSTGRL